MSATALQSAADTVQSAVDALALSLSPVPPAFAADAALDATSLAAAADAAGGFASFDEALASAPAPVLDSAAFGAIADISFLPGGGFWAPLILGLVRAPLPSAPAPQAAAHRATR
eukprot:6560325-Prymnesium_polylepis.2